MTCIFCRILAGQVPCHKVAKSERAFAFLDIRPAAPGHALVIPRTHADHFQDLAEADHDAVMRLARRVARGMMRELKPMRVGLAVLGFDVPHAHVHLVPMRGPGELAKAAQMDSRPPAPTTETLAAMALRLRNALEGDPHA